MSNDINSIQYEGRVSIKYERNGRILKSINKHNTGCKPLFTFITDCLVGDYQEANRPTYIMLYNNTDAEVNPTNLGTPTIYALQYNVNSQSGFNSGDNYGYAKYKFIIPGSMLSMTSNVIALYNLSNSSTYNTEAMKPSTYLQLLGDDIIIKEDVTNTNIIIIWELRISNK